MRFLNIFLQPDGTVAWETLGIIAAAFLAGWLLNRLNAKRAMDKQVRATLAEQERNYRRLEGEYKNYRANIQSAEKHNDKAVVELNNRVKALEGDIRVLADERNKSYQQFADKDKEIRQYISQLGERDEVIRSLKENIAQAKDNMTKSGEEWAEKLRSSGQSLTKAMAWEDKVKAAESDANKAREALSHAERRRLDAELRLKSVTEYAGRIGPLETELAAKNNIIADLHDKLRSAEDLTQRLNTVSAELESLKSSWHKM